MQLHIIRRVTTPRIASNKVGAWIELNRAQKSLLGHIEARLKHAEMPPLSWYDVLLELRGYEDEGLRPKQLEKRLLLPQYGLSRLLDRMENAKLLERRKAPDDGRGQTIHITRAGLALQKRMWPVYAAALDEAFASKLTGPEADTLWELLKRFRQSG